MMKRTTIILSLLLLACVGWGQNLRLSFFSESGARFYVYLNGILQNETSVGNITLEHLEDKEYHVRIEIDDPYQMVCTQRLHPSETKYEYTVNFNAVRERIYVKPARAEKEPTELHAVRGEAPRLGDKPPVKRGRKDSEPEPTGTTGNAINRVKSPVTGE